MGQQVVDDQEFAARLRTLDQRQEQFLNRLDALDQRDTALLHRLERLNDRLDLLAGQSGQIADELVDHKRDPDAHN
jgi:hypothetical protein